jgi:isopropylmalate/homocitrate/citramalate synthase
MQKNDRKAEQDKKGDLMRLADMVLQQKVREFNKEFGYDYELVRKTQVKEYMKAATILKVKINNVCDTIGALHPWLK